MSRSANRTWNDCSEDLLRLPPLPRRFSLLGGSLRPGWRDDDVAALWKKERRCKPGRRAGLDAKGPGRGSSHGDHGVVTVKWISRSRLRTGMTEKWTTSAPGL